MKKRQTLSLETKTVLVSGASRGIGFAICEVLLNYGARVIATSRSEQIPSALIPLIGPQCSYYSCDVAKPASVQQLADNLNADSVTINGLVNNAGTINPISSLYESHQEDWLHAIDVNIKGVYLMMRAFLPQMVERNSGRIINLSSGAANSALAGWSHYCASKAAVKKLTEISQKEVGERDVQIIGLSPGTVATDMMKTIKESGVNPVSKIDWSRHIPPNWVGEATAFLFGPEGSEFAGTDFSIKTIDGRKRVGLPFDDLTD